MSAIRLALTARPANGRDRSLLQRLPRFGSVGAADRASSRRGGVFRVVVPARGGSTFHRTGGFQSYASTICSPPTSASSSESSFA